MPSLFEALPVRWRPQLADYELLPLIGAAYHLPRRRLCTLVTFVVLASIAAVSLVTLAYDYDTLKMIQETVPDYWAQKWRVSEPLDAAPQQNYVLGPRTLSFRGLFSLSS